VHKLGNGKTHRVYHSSRSLRMLHFYAEKAISLPLCTIHDEDPHDSLQCHLCVHCHIPNADSVTNLLVPMLQCRQRQRLSILAANLLDLYFALAILYSSLLHDEHGEDECTLRP